MNYNIVTLNLDDGQNNTPISSGMNYLLLLDAPAGANVRVRLNDNTADEIPLRENYAIKTSNINQIYISADIIPGGVIKIAQSNNSKDFEIITAPAIIDIDSINKLIDFDTYASSKLQLIPNDSASTILSSDSSYRLDTRHIFSIRYIASANILVEINNNGVLLPLTTDEIIFTHQINEITFYNKSVSDIDLSFLVNGDTSIDKSYVTDDYVEDGYVE
jgi:hypothetical protein